MLTNVTLFMFTLYFIVCNGYSRQKESTDSLRQELYNQFSPRFSQNCFIYVLRTYGQYLPRGTDICFLPPAYPCHDGSLL
jgi:hypothetical protein